MSHDQALQKVGEIQALHPDWDPNDIYEALCVTNFNNAQAILKLMIQDKSRKAIVEPTPRKSDSESPFASVGIIQQQYYKEQQLKREGTIVDYFDRNNNRDSYNRHDDDCIAFPSDEENYDDDFQTNENNNTSTISSPKKNANQSNLQRSRDTRQQNHVVQSQYAYTAKEKSGKRSAATQSQISSHFKTNNNDATNKPQTSYKSQYSYFGSGFTLRSKSNVHSKVENSSRKRKRSKFLDDFWNSDEEDLEDVYVHNSSYNSDSDNSSNKHRTKSPAEKIQTFKSKYFQQKSHEQVPSDKIDKNNHQSGDQYHEEEIIHHEHEEADNYQYEEPTNQRTSFTNSCNEQQQVYAEEYEHEHEVVDDNNEENYRYDDEGQQHYDEEMPREEHQTRHDDEQNQGQEEQYDEDDNNRDYDNNENRHDHFRKEIDAKISDIDEEGPSLYIPTILVDSETPDPIVVSDSDSSQLTAPTTNSSINSNNPILIDSSPIRSNESTAETNKNNNNKKNSNNNNNVQNISANPTKIQLLDDEMAYFEKIKNAAANKRRKIILD